jgi:hypothetical protein
MLNTESRHSGAERFNQIVRIVVLVLSAGVMAAGLVVLLGMVHLRSVPDQFRWILGTVVFLYGLYRFVIAYVRGTARR